MNLDELYAGLAPTDLADVIENVLARKQAGQKIRLQDIPQAEARPSGSVRPRPSPNGQPPTANGPLEQVDSLVQQVDFFAEPPADPVLCSATTKSGEPCRAKRLVGSTFCMSHDPAYAEQQRENVRSGGVASGVARQPLPFVDPETLNLADRASVQAIIDAVLRLELSGKIPPSRSRVIVRLLSLAVRNFDRPGRETCYDAVIATHDPETYAERRHALDAHLGDIVKDLAGDELNRRTSAIADIGYKRQEYLKANDMFAPPPPRVRGSDPPWPNGYGRDDR